MARILPAPDEQAPRIRQGHDWMWRMTLIEAKPLKLEGIQHAVGDWRFRGEMPPLFQDPVSRRWYVEERTRTYTGTESCEEIRESSVRVWLPSDITLWHASDDARRLMVLARHDARALFEEQARSFPKRAPCDDNWAEHGVMTLFANRGLDEPEQLCFRDCMHFLRPAAPYLTKMAEEYAKSLCWLYGVEARVFEEGCRLQVKWISPEHCQPLSLPPASACWMENGPIVHVGVGPASVCLDFAPSLRADPTEREQDMPIRVAVPEGVMVCVDGACRMRYSQGFPARRGIKEGWLALTFFMDCTPQSKPVSYERETRSIVMHTPVVAERVVSTQRPIQHPPHTVDSLTDALHAMRRHIRSAESHTMLQRILGYRRSASSSDGSIGMLEKSSSIKDAE